MLLTAVFAYLHLLALAVGLGAVWVRAQSLQRLPHGGSLAPVFTSDIWWTAALGVWLFTGLVRAIAGLEKTGAYYLHNGIFWIKMAVFTFIFVVELWPMTTILQWGLWVAKGREVDLGSAPQLARISRVQAGLVVVAVGLAVLMARGAILPVRLP